MDNYYDYEALTMYNGGRTPTGEVKTDWSTGYFRRCLYERAMSVIKFGLPTDWNMQYFKNVLFRNGYIGIVDTAKYGVIPQICTLRGFGIYMQPTEILVAQPLVEFEGRIGETCEVIKLTPSYMGIWDIIEHYAAMLSNIYTSTNVALENSRLSYILAGKNKAACETLKVIAEKVSGGEPVIVTDKQLKEDMDEGDSLFTQFYDVKNNYITDKLLADTTTILAQFDREIGIPSVDEKKERMLTDEVTVQNSDACARLDTWMECLNESIEKTNRLFGTRITAERRKNRNDEADNDRSL